MLEVAIVLKPCLHLKALLAKHYIAISHKILQIQIRHSDIIRINIIMIIHSFEYFERVGIYLIIKSILIKQSEKNKNVYNLSNLSRT